MCTELAVSLTADCADCPHLTGRRAAGMRGLGSFDCITAFISLCVSGFCLDPLGFLTGMIGRILWKEVRVAALLGVVLGVVNFLRILLLTSYGTQVALVVSVAMFFTIVIAKGIGCTLPLLAKAIHLDPALMASPIITTLVDATALIILFGIATRVFQIAR